MTGGHHQAIGARCFFDSYPNPWNDCDPCIWNVSMT